MFIYLRYKTFIATPDAQQITFFIHQIEKCFGIKISDTKKINTVMTRHTPI